MPTPDLDVIGVGNAIVDVLAEADDGFLEKLNYAKGGMFLIDEDEAKTIYDAMGTSVEISGGSAANSIACIASLGGKGGFIGKVADDALGETYRRDLRALGVEFDTATLADANGPGTGRCLIHVTPDAQRTMTTYLGAAGLVEPDDVEEAFILRAAMTFFEGYQFEQPVARAAFQKACEVARGAGYKSALTLSDVGVVDRQHAALLEFIPTHVDILMANEQEGARLFGTDDLDQMINAAPELCPLTAITLSEKGSVLVPQDGEPVHIDAVKPTSLVDTTGAGDAYAAGLLFGIARGKPLATAGALGSLAASEVISHFGARPQRNLAEMAREAGLLE